jgi:osmotically-inducible protein OsmY
MDKQQSHRGRGPKGYKRSDDRIREDINDRLSDDPWVDASDIEVSVNNGEVTLSGHVPERGAKRRTEDLVESVSGVTHVENRLRVTSVREDEFKYPTAATSGGATNTNSRAENGKTRSSGAI